MIRLIAAIDRSRGIAKKGFQPWSIPEDEQYFTDQTKLHGGVILTGKKTFDTFNGPLKDRQNFVLTSHDEPIEGVELVHDLWAFLREQPEVWVVGGASVFEQALNHADELYLTEIDAEFKCDQFFPDYRKNFKLESQTGRKEQNGFFYTYSVYRKNK